MARLKRNWSRSLSNRDKYTIWYYINVELIVFCQPKKSPVFTINGYVRSVRVPSKSLSIGSVGRIGEGKILSKNSTNHFYLKIAPKGSFSCKGANNSPQSVVQMYSNHVNPTRVRIQRDSTS